MTAPTLGVLAPTPTTWLFVAVVLVVLAVVTILCVLRARRLDSLHRRTDAARAGLADALEHRGTVALRVADAVERPHGDMWSPETGSEQPHGDLWPSSEADGLRAAAHDALTACRAGVGVAGADLELCEAAENTLTRRLAAVDRAALPDGLAGELVDAEQLTLLARRVHNDAVRDTLDLRSRRLVRWLRLAGTAPVPAYFEIADPPRWSAAPRPPVPVPVPPVSLPPAAGGGTAGSGVPR